MDKDNENVYITLIDRNGLGGRQRKVPQLKMSTNCQQIMNKLNKRGSYWEFSDSFSLYKKIFYTLRNSKGILCAYICNRPHKVFIFLFRCLILPFCAASIAFDFQSIKL